MTSTHEVEGGRIYKIVCEWAKLNDDERHEFLSYIRWDSQPSMGTPIDLRTAECRIRRHTEVDQLKREIAAEDYVKRMKK